MRVTKQPFGRRLGGTALAGAVVAGLLTAVAGAAPAQALHGQTDAAPGEFPYHADVGIWGTAGPAKGCDGAMIDPEWVITAGHCVDPSVGGTATIVGKPVLIAGYGGKSITSTVTESHLAPRFGPNGDWREDIALLRIEPRDNVPTIALSNKTLAIGDTYLSVADGVGSDGKLGSAELTVTDQTENGMSGASADTLTIFNDHGDSGSPAIIRTPEGDQLVGVLQSGAGSHETGVTGYSMRLDYAPLRNWIQQTIPTIDFAASHPGYYELRSVNSGQVLDIEGYSYNNGAHAVQWPRTGIANQHWSFRTVHGKTQIVNRNSGLVLGVLGGLTGAGAGAVQWAATGAPDQEWTLVPRLDGSYTIVNGNSGQDLAIGNASRKAGDGAIQWPDTGGTEQRWELIKVG